MVTCHIRPRSSACHDKLVIFPISHKTQPKSSLIAAPPPPRPPQLRKRSPTHGGTRKFKPHPHTHTTEREALSTAHGSNSRPPNFDGNNTENGFAGVSRRPCSAAEKELGAAQRVRRRQKQCPICGGGGCDGGGEGRVAFPFKLTAALVYIVSRLSFRDG